LEIEPILENVKKPLQRDKLPIVAPIIALLSEKSLPNHSALSDHDC